MPRYPQRPLQRFQVSTARIGVGLAPARTRSVREEEYDLTPVRPRWVS